jgi:hypothetical protein
MHFVKVELLKKKCSSCCAPSDWRWRFYKFFHFPMDGFTENVMIALLDVYRNVDAGKVKMILFQTNINEERTSESIP